MSYSDEKLSAFLDGELPPEEMEEIETLRQSDPEVRARLSDLARSDTAIRNAYGTIDDRPLPAEVQALLNDTDGPTRGTPENEAGNVVSFPALRRAGAQIGRWATPLAASIALIVGLGAGMQIGGPGGSSTIDLAGTVGLSSPLYSVLETGESATAHPIDDDTTITPVATFETRSGQYCREFRFVSNTAARRAIACRRNTDSWRIELAIAGEPAGNGDTGFAPASGPGNGVIGRYVNETLDGMPLSAAEERSLLQRNWRTP